jgi:hypothetical protein
MDQSPQVPPTRIIPSGEIRKGDRLVFESSADAFADSFLACPLTAHRTSHRDRPRLGVQEIVSLPPFNQGTALEHFFFSIVLWVTVV